ncbi:MAG: PKD domain-containing protein [Candidatus Peribacteria bacterium]|nr:MAG: PKD domain-containing protein [Candidatus Peribacteria bacterium]
MRKIIGIISTLLLLVVPAVFQAQAEDISEPNYTKLREIDKGTFNEYRYRITGEYFKLREKFEISGTVDKNIANQIFLYAREGYKYLPDNLRNQNYYNNLVTALKRGIKYPDNEASYTEIVKAVEKYLDDVDIQTITGSVEVTPTSGNAPLTVTLRGRVKDPTGSVIPTFNYIWWIDDGGERKIIGRKQSITYTFRDEGNFSVFLDVVSAHKNEEGFTDVLPFRSRGDIEVKEKVASLIIKVNDSYLRNNSELKFDPTEASYGLIFDATSSTPTSGTDFIRTEWDFGNGVERKYDGEPRIERVVYAKEGDYTVTLRLKTNELRQVERKFRVAVHKPIATIRASREEGFMGDKFTFSAESGGNDENLSYSWEIVDIDRGEVIFTKSGNLFTYAFTKKGEYSIKLNVLEPSGDRDQDDFTVYINSRAPVADFTYKIPKYSKPNELLLDASRSFDPDFSDDGKLEYIWTIDGERVKLERPNANGSVGYYTFDSVGDHSVSLEVTDPDSISAVKSDKVQVTSVLSVDFNTFPRVIARDGSIRFVADSPNARFYEWDFGDGESEAGNSATMTHKYTKSGLFTVSLRVRDAEDTTNSFEKTVYVAESNSPVAVIDLDLGNANEPPLVPKSCEGQSAYVVSRVDSIRFSGLESINIDGENNNLEYSWKLGNNTYFTSSNFNYTFDDLGCIPVKLTVKSKDNGATHVRQVWIKVENKLPELTSLTIDVQDPETDPVIVNVTALGAKDRDGIIQSYLWYYYTDIDPEPQDFRVTNKPGTTFVLPKVTGNYYFVVVLKDNNEARVTSEEVTGSKFFTTLAGDNINTPLIDFRVSDSSVSIGEEVEFNVIAKNILGQDISKAATYFWDFNGDGFYDVETSTPQAKYSYPQSGSYFAKVKVKHKGFSNTRNLTVDVSNKLVANFDVVSIGNTYVFANTSL